MIRISWFDKNTASESCELMTVCTGLVHFIAAVYCRICACFLLPICHFYDK